MDLRTCLLLALTCQGVLAASDVVVLHDRVVEGTLVEVSEKKVVLETERGRKLEFQRDDVRGVLKGQTAEDYVRLMAGTLASDDAEHRAELGSIARESGLDDLAEQLYLEVLALDPGNNEAGRGLGFVKVKGKWEPHPQDPTVRRAPSAPAPVKVTGPNLAYSFEEQIAGMDWSQFSSVCPDYTWREAISNQLIGQLFHQDHAWGLVHDDGSQGEHVTPQLRVEVKTAAHKTKTTTWMTHKVQDFYEATIELKLVRLSDDACVLWVKSVAERGNRLEGQAARNALITAARNITGDEKVLASPVWSDWETAPATGQPISVTQAKK